MNLMLLCAGEGTRLRPHTLTHPKPAIPFLGAPMATYSLEWAREVATDRLVVNTFHLTDKVHRLFHGLTHGFADLKFSDEKQLMGSGGGVSLARNFLRGKGDFLVMNGDEVTIPVRTGFLKEAYQKHQAEKRTATLMVMNYPGVGTKFGGVWVDDQNRVLGFGKTPIAGAVRAWHFIGPTFLSEKIFDRLPLDSESNLLYDGLAAAIAHGENVSVEMVEGWWHETGNEKDFLEATQDAFHFLAANGGQGKFLRSVLNRHVPGWKIESGGGAFCLRLPGATVDSSSELQGFCVLGAGSEVGRDCEVKNVVLGNEAQLPNGSRGINFLQL